jgi:hypothetical protein
MESKEHTRSPSYQPSRPFLSLRILQTPHHYTRAVSDVQDHGAKNGRMDIQVIDPAMKYAKRCDGDP